MLVGRNPRLTGIAVVGLILLVWGINYLSGNTSSIASNPVSTPSRFDPVDVRELSKNPDRYRNQGVVVEGEVFRIQQDGSDATMQVWVQIPNGGDYDREPVTVSYRGQTDGVYEKTRIAIQGRSDGLLRGTNAFGASASQPHIEAYKVTVINTP